MKRKKISKSPIFSAYTPPEEIDLDSARILFIEICHYLKEPNFYEYAVEESYEDVNKEQEVMKAIAADTNPVSTFSTVDQKKMTIRFVANCDTE